jgi:transposase
MELLHERCAGIDLSKRDAKVCFRLPTSRKGYFSKTVYTYSSMYDDVCRLRDDLVDAGVTLVVMEATGDYWKPFYHQLAGALNVVLVNARHVKNIPGRKTDVNDAQWLAQLGA